jgi:hypothetical protein
MVRAILNSDLESDGFGTGLQTDRRILLTFQHSWHGLGLGNPIALEVWVRICGREHLSIGAISGSGTPL